MQDTLAELEVLRGSDRELLEVEPLTRAAAERLIQVIVDLAIDINGHVAVATLGRAPQTGRDSFAAAAEAGALPAALADALAPSAGLRNVLVHRYTDIRIELVADSITIVLDGFAEYVKALARFLDR